MRKAIGAAMLWAGVLAGVATEVALTMAVFMSLTSGPVSTAPWYGRINGQMTHCTMDTYASGDRSLNDCWR